MKKLFLPFLFAVLVAFTTTAQTPTTLTRSLWLTGILASDSTNFAAQNGRMWYGPNGFRFTEGGVKYSLKSYLTTFGGGGGWPLAGNDDFSNDVTISAVTPNFYTINIGDIAGNSMPNQITFNAGNTTATYSLTNINESGANMVSVDAVSGLEARVEVNQTNSILSFTPDGVDVHNIIIKNDGIEVNTAADETHNVTGNFYIESAPSISSLFVGENGGQGSAGFGSGNTSLDITENNAFTLSNQVTAGGVTGNITIDRPAGTVNFAAAATTLTVTNTYVDINSIILCTARTNDATCSVKNVVAAAGSFVINLTAGCTNETSVGFFVIN
jgi:hypothetical protein